MHPEVYVNSPDGHSLAAFMVGGATSCRRTEGLPVISNAKSPLAVANGLNDKCSTLVDARSQALYPDLILSEIISRRTRRVPPRGVPNF